MLSKMDSRVIEDVIVIKGPFSARHGPGFNFVDFVLFPAERFPNGREMHGTTSFDYQANGEQWYGRQTVWTGGSNWGARATYGHHTGNDYHTGDNAGAGFDVRSSYNSRDLVLALGYDLDTDRHLDFHLLRLDQTGVEFAGFGFDMRYLVTDGYELRYVDESPTIADRLNAEAWYNRTRFEGPTNENAGGPASGFSTDVDSLSTGYRVALDWGDADDGQTTLGTDMIYYTNNLYERLDNTGLGGGIDIASTIPDARSLDFGLFAERIWTPYQPLTLTAGARLDLIQTDAENVAPFGADLTNYMFVNTLDREFVTYSLFLTARQELNERLALRAGVGHALRPPTLTELYVADALMGLLQGGLTLYSGDPNLPPEKLTQVDVGIEANCATVRGRISGFYGWYHDYIAFDLPGGVIPPANAAASVNFVNTDRAYITGIEAYGEHDVRSWLIAFVSSSWLQGKDLTRRKQARRNEILQPGANRGDPGPFSALTQEWLPGIPPLDTTLGLRLHEADDRPRWKLELTARIVDGQDLEASSLDESETPGLTVYSIRGEGWLTERWRVIAGVENLGDKFFIEHLDLRTGRGVYRPGRSFYVGSELTY